MMQDKRRVRYQLVAMLLVLLTVVSFVLREQALANAGILLKSGIVMTSNRMREALVWEASETSDTSVEVLETMGSFCTTWGAVNLDDWWTHHVNYVVAKENTTHQCFRRDNESERALFLQRIYRNQFNSSSCNNVHVRFIWSSGWGADFNNMRDGLVIALKEGRPYAHIFDKAVKKPWWHYSAFKTTGANATCPSKGTECYFLNYSSCPSVNYQNYTKDQMSSDFERWRYQDVKPWAYMFMARGQQWLRKEVADFVHANKPAFFDEEEEDKKIKCSVIHVRRGDSILQKTGNNRIYHAISDYLEQLPEDRRQPGSNVLLLTDDANAIDEANEFHSEINWHYVNRTRYRGKEGGFGLHVVAKTPKEDAIALLGTFAIAQKCDAMVRGVSSLRDAINEMVDDSCKDRGIPYFSHKLIDGYTNASIIVESEFVLLQKLQQRRAAKNATAYYEADVDAAQNSPESKIAKSRRDMKARNKERVRHARW